MQTLDWLRTGHYAQPNDPGKTLTFTLGEIGTGGEPLLLRAPVLQGSFRVAIILIILSSTHLLKARRRSLPSSMITSRPKIQSCSRVSSPLDMHAAAFSRFIDMILELQIRLSESSLVNTGLATGARAADLPMTARQPRTSRQTAGIYRCDRRCFQIILLVARNVCGT